MVGKARNCSVTVLTPSFQRSSVVVRAVWAVRVAAA
jgi:hypothetical protein